MKDQCPSCGTFERHRRGCPQATPRKRSLGAYLRREGFDRSVYDREEHAWYPRCSSCQVLVIQGVPCHEQRCPNIRR